MQQLSQSQNRTGNPCFLYLPEAPFFFVLTAHHTPLPPLPQALRRSGHTDFIFKGSQMDKRGRLNVLLDQAPREYFKVQYSTDAVRRHVLHLIASLAARLETPGPSANDGKCLTATPSRSLKLHESHVRLITQTQITHHHCPRGRAEIQFHGTHSAQ